MQQLGAHLSWILRASAGSARRYRALAIGALLATTALTATEAGPDTRTLKLYNIHTAERLTITYKQNGRYVPEALNRLNQFVGDWRRKESIGMDPALFDILWTVYQDTGATGEIHIVCGYRSPETNSMLRRRSKGVAKNSQHTRGKAMDFFIPGVPLEKLRIAGLRLQTGGVGYYPSSGSPFVHVDTGSVRHWPRMTREQLARVFPDGRTLHIPSDGKPLPGYEIALAEYKARGSVSSSSFPAVQIVAASVATPATAAPTVAPAGSRPNGLLASLAKPRPGPTAAPAEPVVAALPGADEPELIDAVATGSVGNPPLPRAAPLRIDDLFERAVNTPHPEGATTRRYMLVGKAKPGKSIAQRVEVSFGRLDESAPEKAAPASEPGERAMAFAASADTSGPDPLRLMLAETAPGPARKAEPAQTPVTTAALPPAEPSRPANILHDPAPRLAFVAAQADWGRTLWTVKASTRHRNFADLMMPDPEADPTILAAPVRVIAGGFSARPYGGLRTDHFAGVVAQPVSTIDFSPARRLALLIER